MPRRDSLKRREFLKQSALATPWAWSLLAGATRTHAYEAGTTYRVGTFSVDVTPPIGHSCCGGWIKPIETVDDPLRALGVILEAGSDRFVICAVDWTGILNSGHVMWREAIARAAGTTPDRVAVHCVHQHNAPMACPDAQQIVAAQGDLPAIVDMDFFRDCVQRVAAAVGTACKPLHPLTHIGRANGRVEKVASNRRVDRDENGVIRRMRGSSCRIEDLRAMTEGLIDRNLKTVAFYSGEQRVACCHYYATHPMSYYADGRCTSDFVGLARQRRQEEDPGCLHVYFTGCAGNVSAGKYNDGAHETRPILTERMYQGILAAERNLQPRPLREMRWSSVEALPQGNPVFDASAIEAAINDSSNSVVARNRPAYTLAWLRRVQQGTPLVLSCLHLDDTSLLHLPAESFIEYQLRAQRIGGSRFVATAAYGDGGPWYLPTAWEYNCGGYEVSVAFCAPTVDQILTRSIAQLLT